jgi:DNA-binding CsgD family transcriptional regulator
MDHPYDSNAHRLSARESEVLQLISKGNTSKQVAAHLGIAFKTACCHRTHILAKLGARNTAEALTMATMQGLIADAKTGSAPSGHILDTELGVRVEMVLTLFRQVHQQLSATLRESDTLPENLSRARDELQAVGQHTQALLNQALSYLVLNGSVRGEAQAFSAQSLNSVGAYPPLPSIS